MYFRQKIFSGIGALAFVALLTLNVQLVNKSYASKNADGFVSLSMIELKAQAQSESGGGNWDEVCCGDMCSGGMDHCLGDGTYLCCKP